jgi:hypothetical protein
MHPGLKLKELACKDRRVAWRTHLPDLEDLDSQRYFLEYTPSVDAQVCR